MEGVPAFVVHSGGALGVAGLLAAAGLRMLEWVGCVAHHHRLRANHPLGGSGDGLRAGRRTAGCCHGYGGRLRLGHLAGGAAEFAAGLGVTLGPWPNRPGGRRGVGAPRGIIRALAT